MKKNFSLDCLIPCPREIIRYEGVMSLDGLNSYSLAECFSGYKPLLLKYFKSYGIHLHPKVNGDMVLEYDGTLPPEGFLLTVQPNRIKINASSDSGMFYAIKAFSQILAVAFMRGRENAFLDCGKIMDYPRMKHRSFMLDSVRHFQPVGVIRELIEKLSDFRINSFHWHLTDNEGWRFPFSQAPEMKGEKYTVEEIKDLVEFAKIRHIQIIPEIDVPGHSKALLEHFPAFSCDPEIPGRELCISNPKVQDFIKAAIRELTSLFPESNYIHLGGDEADNVGWYKCPKCRAALENLKSTDMRSLERMFMMDLCNYVESLNRKPMVWGTGSAMPASVTIQVWQNILEFGHILRNRNQCVNSVHSSYYFDYPANMYEPCQPWMFGLTEENIYLADSRIHYGPGIDEFLLGTEACLWTEFIPMWRIMGKVMPRLPAYSEVAWSMPNQRDWSEFNRRKGMLLSAGWLSFQ